MRKLKLLTIILAVGLAGCTLIQPQPIELDTITVISQEGFIYRPLVGSGDDWTVQPGNIELLDFGSGRDSYGNRTGLLDDVRWTLDAVTIQLDEKIEEDTVFWPSNLNANQLIWFPGWTAQIELISGLPYPMYPLTGYPWDTCQTHVIDVMPSQMATITASAVAEWIEVEITLPERSGGQYTLNLPGYTPTADNVLTVRLGSSQEIIATWTNGTGEKSWLFDVPVDWFWVNGSWEINVGPSGVCYKPI